MGELEGKIALITGGSSCIGLATAKRFVDEGAHAFITGRRGAELASAVKDIGKNVKTKKATSQSTSSIAFSRRSKKSVAVRTTSSASEYIHKFWLQLLIMARRFDDAHMQKVQMRLTSTKWLGVRD